MNVLFEERKGVGMSYFGFRGHQVKSRRVGGQAEVAPE